MPAAPLPARAQRIAELRETVRAIVSAGPGRAAGLLPFGIAALDERLAGGGLATGALHEATGAGGMADDAAATLFLAGIAARRRVVAGPEACVLWAFARAELFGPGLQQAGLAPAHLILAEAGDDAAVLAVMEEGLRHGGIAAVIGEVRVAAMAATRRLQLAAEERGVTALLLRRPRARGPDKQGRDALGEPSAACTRWRVAAAPSLPLPEPVGTAGIGRACWRLDLVRQRGGDGFSIHVEGSDAEGRLALFAGLRDRPAAPDRPEDGEDRIAHAAA